MIPIAYTKDYVLYEDFIWYHTSDPSKNIGPYKNLNEAVQYILDTNHISCEGKS